MPVLVELQFVAPIPVGHLVSLVSVEQLTSPLSSLFGGGTSGQWNPMPGLIACDEDTRIIYADRNLGLRPESTYEQVLFTDDTLRLSTVRAPLRGRVTSCLVLSDHGERVYLRTMLGLEPVP